MKNLIVKAPPPRPKVDRKGQPYYIRSPHRQRLDLS